MWALLAGIGRSAAECDCWLREEGAGGAERKPHPGNKVSIVSALSLKLERGVWYGIMVTSMPDRKPNGHIFKFPFPIEMGIFPP